MKEKIERRFGTDSPEVRKAGGKPTIAGYAALFDVEANLLFFREKIAPGAFRRAIRERHDVRGLLNHNPDLVLGRTTAGTLRLVEDRKGLHYEIDPPDTTVGHDVTESIRRGDISQSSFAFIVKKHRWIEPDKN